MFQLARKYDFHPARAADGHWDPADNLQMSGPDPVSMADRSGNGRLLSYRSALGSATAAQLNGYAAVRFPRAANSFYSDAAGALLGAGVDQPFVVYGSFKLDDVVGQQTIFTFDSAATVTDYVSLVVSGSLFYVGEYAAVGGNTFAVISESIVPGEIYTYVVRRNSTGTVDVWLNGVQVDTALAFAGNNMAAMTRFNFGSRDLTGWPPDRTMNGIFSASGFRAGSVDSGWCEQVADWLHYRYGWSARWRLFITATTGAASTSLAKLEMRGAVGGADLCSGGVAGASSELSGSRVAGYAFNDNIFQFWESSTTDISGDGNAWLEYHFPAPREVVEVAMTADLTTSAGDRAPKDFALQYWDGAVWRTARSWVGETGWTSLETRVFAV